MHVCGASSTWERQHLLLRDYLRGHPAVSDEYGAPARARC
jgi:GrpB-like predicted nucleotidyltransferase (UPF0157 family)